MTHARGADETPALLDDLKDRVCAAVDELRPVLIELSHRIHAHPELQFEEYQACAWLSNALVEAGFEVQRGCCGMETAFLGVLDRSGGDASAPTVAFVAEYDALRGLGHACGHNILGASNVGAGMALARVMDGVRGRVLVFGTPAEEGGGGKIPFVEQGYFDGVTAAISMHPSGDDRPHSVAGRCLAVQPLTFKFYGRPAHAAAAPELGINALDALLQTFNGINALRQQLRDDVRIHGIVVRGGDAVNVIPEYAEAEFLVRCADWDYLLEVVARVKDCARGGALAAGARLEIEEGVAYKDMRPDPLLAEVMLENMRRLGLDPAPMPETVGSYSTDLGNVSHVVPTVSASICIAGPGVVPHKHEFAEAAASPRGDEGLILAAKVMAMTALDVLLRPELREQLAARR